MPPLAKDPRLIPYGTTNLGMALELAPGLIVPNELFFVRSNGGTPRIDPATWRLTIGGHVERPLTLSLADLRAMPQQNLTSFLECAGNSRSRYDPETEGTTWRNDAAGNAIWSGVQVAELLRLAGVRPGAVDLVSQGADLIDMRRGLPIELALGGAVLLAIAMNKQPLEALHGAPCRLLVPGWAGIASTKWLTALEVWDHPFTGVYQGELYLIYDESGESIAPVREMPPKSLIAWPAPGATLPAGDQLVTGMAWSGYAPIERVELQIGNDGEWRPAQIVARADPWSWVRWSYRWPAQAGRHELRVRARDARGLTQPIRSRWNTKGYLMNEIQTVEVIVSRSDV